MPISKQDILATLATIEARAPLFLGNMPVADDVARDIFASAMASLSAMPTFAAAEPACREASLLATLTHVLLETACLRHHLHAVGEQAHVETERLLAKAAGY